MKKLNKKGQVLTTMIQSIPDLFFLIVAVFAVTLIVSMFVKTNVDVTDAESRIIGMRPLYSLDGISYYDQDMKRLFPGTVDAKKLNEEQLNNSMEVIDNKFVAARYSLQDFNGKKISEAYYNKELFERLEPTASFSGLGASRMIKMERIVLLKNSEHKIAVLKAEIVTPNS